jgi:hypothetical protein
MDSRVFSFHQSDCPTIGHCILGRNQTEAPWRGRYSRIQFGRFTWFFLVVSLCGNCLRLHTDSMERLVNRRQGDSLSQKGTRCTNRYPCVSRRDNLSSLKFLLNVLGILIHPVVFIEQKAAIKTSERSTIFLRVNPEALTLRTAGKRDYQALAHLSNLRISSSFSLSAFFPFSVIV